MPHSSQLALYASVAPLESLQGFVEITSLVLVPLVGDQICTNDVIDGKKGIFRVRQRMISDTHIWLWVEFIED